MTIEKMLGMSADVLEKMTIEELNKYFSPFFPTTRPELAAKEKKINKTSVSGNGSVRSSSLDDKMERAKAIAAQYGLNLDDL